MEVELLHGGTRHLQVLLLDAQVQWPRQLEGVLDVLAQEAEDVVPDGVVALQRLGAVDIENVGHHQLARDENGLVPALGVEPLGKGNKPEAVVPQRGFRERSLLGLYKRTVTV